eukprot:9478513-Pyramimonas_sp.AAC.1
MSFAAKLGLAGPAEVVERLRKPPLYLALRGSDLARGCHSAITGSDFLVWSVAECGRGVRTVRASGCRGRPCCGLAAHLAEGGLLHAALHHPR